jgi:hypothetical protein
LAVTVHYVLPALAHRLPMAMQDEALRGARIGFLMALVFLIVQFLLGMAVNLFVTIPTNHPGANPPEYFSGVAQSVTWALLQGPLLLILHAGLGLLLVFAAIGLLVRGIQSRTRSMILATSFGAFGVLAAGFNGGSFLNYNQDFSSMLMASAFAIAVIAYSVGLYLTAASPKKT